MAIQCRNNQSTIYKRIEVLYIHLSNYNIYGKPLSGRTSFGGTRNSPIRNKHSAINMESNLMINKNVQMTKKESLFIVKCLKCYYYTTKRFYPYEKDKIGELKKILNKLEILNDNEPVSDHK